MMTNFGCFFLISSDLLNEKLDFTDLLYCYSVFQELQNISILKDLSE
jgi:hypothetical protein